MRKYFSIFAQKVINEQQRFCLLPHRMAEASQSHAPAMDEAKAKGESPDVPSTAESAPSGKEW